MDKYAKQFKYRENQRNKKERLRLNSSEPIREPFYHPPEYRGFKIEGNLDFGYLKIIYITLWDSGRIDSYYVRKEPIEKIGKKPRLDDGNDNWWRDEKGNKKKFGKVNIDKELRRLFPTIRRHD